MLRPALLAFALVAAACGEPTSRAPTPLPPMPVEASAGYVPPDPAGESRKAPLPDVAAQRTALAGLRIEVDGHVRRLAPALLERLEPTRVVDVAKRGGRDAWDVRTLLGAVAGAEARLTGVRRKDGTTLAVPPAAWASPLRRPVLRVNRRGMLKFHWAPSRGGRDRGSLVRGVTALIARTR